MSGLIAEHVSPCKYACETFSCLDIKYMYCPIPVLCFNPRLVISLFIIEFGTYGIFFYLTIQNPLRYILTPSLSRLIHSTFNDDRSLMKFFTRVLYTSLVTFFVKISATFSLVFTKTIFKKPSSTSLT